MTDSTQLRKAAASGDAVRVAALLDAGADIDAAGDVPDAEDLRTLASMLRFMDLDEALSAQDLSLGFTPLLEAAAADRPEVVRLLLERGADPMKKDVIDRTPLVLALSERAEGAAAELIAAGVGLDEQARGRPPLSIAIDQGLWRCVDRLLAAGAEVNPKKINRSDHPLMACLHSDPPGAGRDTVDGVLQESKDQEVQEHRRRAEDCLLRLLEAGSVPRHAEVLSAALGRCSSEVVGRLVDAAAGNPKFFEARSAILDPVRLVAVRSDLPLLRKLHAAGAVVGDVKDQWSLLSEAVTSAAPVDERIACMDWLLAQGLDVDHADTGGFTALHAAVRAERPGIVSWLLERGADPGLRKRGVRPPWIWWRSNGTGSSVDRRRRTRRGGWPPTTGC